MSLSLKISVTDRATPAIEQLNSKLQRDGVKHSAGSSVMRQILDHLTILDATRPNVLGGRRTHFYAKAGKSTSYEITDTGATVSINKEGIAQRLFGGDIKPGPGKKYLTIPARAEAHGRRAGEFNTLQVLFGRHGPYALAEREAVKLRKTKKGYKAGAEVGGGIFFWLVKSVSQHADPSVLPSEESIEQTALSAVSNYINSLIKD